MSSDCVQAQGLSSPLTTTEKLRETSDNVYIICNDKASTIQGFLRLGKKHLFLYPVRPDDVDSRTGMVQPGYIDWYLFRRLAVSTCFIFAPSV